MDPLVHLLLADALAHLSGQVVESLAELLDNRGIETHDVHTLGVLAAADGLDVRHPALVIGVELLMEQLGQLVQDFDTLVLEGIATGEDAQALGLGFGCRSLADVLIPGLSALAPAPEIGCTTPGFREIPRNFARLRETPLVEHSQNRATRTKQAKRFKPLIPEIWLFLDAIPCLSLFTHSLAQFLNNLSSPPIPSSL